MLTELRVYEINNIRTDWVDLATDSFELEYYFWSAWVTGVREQDIEWIESKTLLNLNISRSWLGHGFWIIWRNYMSSSDCSELASLVTDKGWRIYKRGWLSRIWLHWRQLYDVWPSKRPITYNKLLLPTKFVTKKMKWL